MKTLILALVALSSLIFLTGCENSHAATAQNIEEKLYGSVTIAGSTSLQPLADAAGFAFMQKHPDVQVAVSGGGSGFGLSQVQEGSLDIGNSNFYTAERGIDDPSLINHRVAVVGFAPVVHNGVSKSVRNLARHELIGIFTGTITNWSEVGGEDQPIHVIHRAYSSGARANFERWGLDNATVIAGQEQDSAGAVRQLVAQTPGAISYLPFSYLDDSTTALLIDHIAPTLSNVRTNRWRIWAYQHMYTNERFPNPIADDFINFLLTDEIQETIVIPLGYLPINQMLITRDAAGDITELGE